MLRTGIPSGRDPFIPLLIQIVAIPDHARPEQQQQPLQDTVPLQRARMADIGSGAHTRTVDALPRDRELLAGGVGTGAGEEEDNTDAATDEEVECEGVALTTAVGAEHNEHVLG
ncbi:Os02g0773000 [Oryza sativa Japonica Group]|uniref:Os02g0773000 protein n=1 Tax=Oryza sativa subsp. japonica TaxID=39947 RepID=A0A0P0VPZ5_ORYSJ|nr:Os02g0773000 [Oryza sativa Japonica Group]